MQPRRKRFMFVGGPMCGRTPLLDSRVVQDFYYSRNQKEFCHVYARLSLASSDLTYRGLMARCQITTIVKPLPKVLWYEDL